MGVSVAFSFVYATVDLIQYAKDEALTFYYKHYAAMSSTKKPVEQQQIIVTNIQVYLLLTISFIIGSLFGAIFGIVDVEDYYKNKYILYTVLSKEITFCEPIGLVFGAFTGFMIQFLRE